MQPSIDAESGTLRAPNRYDGMDLAADACQEHALELATAPGAALGSPINEAILAAPTRTSCERQSPPLVPSAKPALLARGQAPSLLAYERCHRMARSCPAHRPRPRAEQPLAHGESHHVRTDADPAPPVRVACSRSSRRGRQHQDHPAFDRRAGRLAGYRAGPRLMRVARMT